MPMTILWVGIVLSAVVHLCTGYIPNCYVVSPVVTITEAQLGTDRRVTVNCPYPTLLNFTEGSSNIVVYVNSSVTAIEMSGAMRITNVTILMTASAIPYGQAATDLLAGLLVVKASSIDGFNVTVMGCNLTLQQSTSSASTVPNKAVFLVSGNISNSTFSLIDSSIGITSTNTDNVLTIGSVALWSGSVQQTTVNLVRTNVTIVGTFMLASMTYVTNAVSNLTIIATNCGAWSVAGSNNFLFAGNADHVSISLTSVNALLTPPIGSSNASFVAAGGDLSAINVSLMGTTLTASSTAHLRVLGCTGSVTDLQVGLFNASLTLLKSVVSLATAHRVSLFVDRSNMSGSVESALVEVLHDADTVSIVLSSHTSVVTFAYGVVIGGNVTHCTLVVTGNTTASIVATIHAAMVIDTSVTINNFSTIVAYNDNEYVAPSLVWANDNLMQNVVVEVGRHSIVQMNTIDAIPTGMVWVNGTWGVMNNVTITVSNEGQVYTVSSVESPAMSAVFAAAGTINGTARLVSIRLLSAAQWFGISNRSSLIVTGKASECIVWIQSSEVKYEFAMENPSTTSGQFLTSNAHTSLITALQAVNNVTIYINDSLVSSEFLVAANSLSNVSITIQSISQINLFGSLVLIASPQVDLTTMGLTLSLWMRASSVFHNATKPWVMLSNGGPFLNDVQIDVRACTIIIFNVPQGALSAYLGVWWRGPYTATTNYTVRRWHIDIRNVTQYMEPQVQSPQNTYQPAPLIGIPFSLDDASIRVEAVLWEWSQTAVLDASNPLGAYVSFVGMSVANSTFAISNMVPLYPLVASMNNGRWSKVSIVVTNITFALSSNRLTTPYPAVIHMASVQTADVYMNLTNVNASTSFSTSTVYPSLVVALLLFDNCTESLRNEVLLSNLWAYQIDAVMLSRNTTTTNMSVLCGVLNVSSPVWSCMNGTLQGTSTLTFEIDPLDRSSTVGSLLSLQHSQVTAVEVNLLTGHVTVGTSSGWGAVHINRASTVSSLRWTAASTAVLYYSNTSLVYVGEGSWVDVAYVTGGNVYANASKSLVEWGNASWIRTLDVTNITIVATPVVSAGRWGPLYLSGAPPTVIPITAPRIHLENMSITVQPSTVTTFVGVFADGMTSAWWGNVTSLQYDFPCNNVVNGWLWKRPLCYPFDAPCSMEHNCTSRSTSFTLHSPSIDQSPFVEVVNTSMVSQNTTRSPSKSMSVSSITTTTSITPNASSTPSTSISPTTSITLPFDYGGPSRVPSNTATSSVLTDSHSRSPSDSLSLSPSSSPSRSSSTSGTIVSFTLSGSLSRAMNQTHSAGMTVTHNATDTSSSSATATPPTPTPSVVLRGGGRHTRTMSQQVNVTPPTSPAPSTDAPTSGLAAAPNDETNVGAIVGGSVGGVVAVVIVVALVVCLYRRSTQRTVQSIDSEQPPSLGAGFLQGDETMDAIPITLSLDGVEYTIVEEDQEGFYDTDGYYHYYQDGTDLA